MTRFHVSKDIDAPPGAVWRVLTSRPHLAAGDFGITSLVGPSDTIAAGQSLRLTTAATGSRVFRLKVVSCTAESQMVWRGGMPFGLFVGTRTFQLSATATGTRFEMTEAFTGPLSGLIVRSIPDLTPGFETFAAALAAHAMKGPERTPSPMAPAPRTIPGS